MQMIGRINGKLDKGWKMTDISCPKCNGTTMAELKDQIDMLYCPKQDKTYPFEFEHLVPSESSSKKSEKQDQDKYFDQVIQEMKTQKTQQQPINNKIQSKPYENDDFYLSEKESEALKKTNDVSKKIGEKLLHGWTMLNESCNGCYAPIMKSKRGQKICFGCDKDVTEKKEKIQVVEPVVVKPKVQQKKVETPKPNPIAEPRQKSIETKEEKIESPTLQTKKKNDKSGKSAKSEGRPSISIINRIEEKSLLCLQQKLEEAIRSSDLQKMQNILKMVYKIKSQFK